MPAHKKEEQAVVINYKPHKYQYDIHTDPHRYRVVCAGRRWGKSVLARQEIIRKALTWIPDKKVIAGGIARTPRFWIVSPTLKQGRQNHWNEMKQEIPIELIQKRQGKYRINESELEIELINGVIISIKGADNSDCYDDQTEILTDEGWKFFKDLNKTEQVFTLNKDGFGEWKKPIRYIEEEYSGKMFDIKSKKIDLKVTPNHKFWICSRKGKFKFKKISEISFNDKIPSSIKYKGSGDISNEMCAIMGFYLAEGTARGNSGGKVLKGNYEVFFAQTDEIKGGTKGNVYSKFWNILKKSGYNPSPRYVNRNGTKIIDGIRVLNKDLHQKLINIGNKYNKFIPKEYKNLPPEKLSILLNWLIMGDGCIRGDGINRSLEQVYYTVSKKLADDVQEIAIKCGLSAKITKKNNSDSVIRGKIIKATVPIYTVSIHHSKYNYFRNSKESYIKESFYNGCIYCLEVENHVIMVRRNGSCCWSGNSLRGAGLAGVVMDECAFMKPEIWTQIIQPMLIDTEGWALFISSPNGLTNWFYKIYQQGLENSNIFVQTWKSWHYTSYDNPTFNEEQLSDIDKQKNILSEEEFRQEFLADFVTFKDLIYKDFNFDKHVIEPFDLDPSKYTFYRTIDFGFKHPTGCLWVAVDRDDKWYVFDEYRQAEVSSEQNAGVIKSIHPELNYEATFGDPSAAQLIEDYDRLGIYITPASKSMKTSLTQWVNLGISKVTEKLKLKPDKDGNMKPDLYIFNNCEHLIEELQGYRWKEQPDSTKAIAGQPVKIKDDLVDPLRYLAISVTQPFSQSGDNYNFPKEDLFPKGMYI